MKNSNIIKDMMISTSCNICGCDRYRKIRDIEISPILVSSKLVRCKECGFFYANPILKREAEEDYYRRYYHEEQPECYWYEGRIDVFKRALRQIDKFLKKGRLIDVGCGMGYFMNLAKNEGWEVKGVEISDYAVSYAREKFGLDVIKGSLKDAQFEREYFDVATMWNVLDQIYDPKANLIELNRILKNGGHLFIRVSNLYFHLKLLKLYNRLAVFHLYSFEKYSIKKLLELTGFSNVVVKIESLGVNVPDFVKIFGTKKEKIARNFFNIVGKFLYFLSLGRIVASPSIFIIARKERDL